MPNLTGSTSGGRLGLWRGRIGSGGVCRWISGPLSFGDARLRADRLLRGEYSPLTCAGLLTVVLAALLILTPTAQGRLLASSPPAPTMPAAPAPDVAEVLARAKALKDLGRLREALEVVADAMQLPGATQMLTSPDLHWVQAWLLVSLSGQTGSHTYLVDATDEFRSVITLAGAHTDLGREAQRALDRIARRE